MRVSHHPHYALRLPEGHPFPMSKYTLVRERLIERGDYLIGFFPKGTDDEIVYAVRRGIDAQVRSRFQDCVRRM